MDQLDLPEQSTPTSTADLLSQLLSALTNGARAVQGLPLGDEFEYQSSFPEFRQLIGECEESLVENILIAIEDFYDEDVAFEHNLEDPLLWEACADACDALLERVETHLLEANDTISNNASDLSQLSDTARRRAKSSFGRLLQGIVDMEKPQLIHKLPEGAWRDRRAPFVPCITDKPHSITQLDLSLRPGHGLESRFGDLRGGPSQMPPNIVAPSHHVPHVYAAEIQEFSYTDRQIEAPSKRPPKIDPDHQPKELSATWIYTLQGLEQLCSDILDSSIQEIALDLEAHSYHSFAGLTCLIQLSYRREDDHQQGDQGKIHNYLIDPFPLWNQLNQVLGPILANPEIVKVLHGADSDVQWLQRDFGLYVVNLFDTGRAARALGFPSAGYAYLLKHYAGISSDKSHQLSDWRQRPLPPSMKHYAIMDTHYLIEIYHHLRYDLSCHAETSIIDVLDLSRKISLIRYGPEPFNPDGYKSLIQGKRRFKKGRQNRRVESDLNDSQEAVLRCLYDWRDQTARGCDESLEYVCPKSALVRLALACPKSLTTLQGLLNPMPPLVLRFSKDVLGIIQYTLKDGTNKSASHPKTPITKLSKAPPPVGAPSSAFFKPAKSGDEQTEEQQRVRLMSPVLGTEALYSQAGWITPQQAQQHQRHDQHSSPTHRGGSSTDDQIDTLVTTTDDDIDDDNNKSGGGSKPRKTLTVNEANYKYRSNQCTPHSLQLGNSSNGADQNSVGQLEPSTKRSVTSSGRSQLPKLVDGMGPARAAKEHSAITITTSIEEDADIAQRNAADVRSSLARDDQMIGLISPSIDIDGDDDDDEANSADRDENEEGGREKTREKVEEEFVIPRSMREIYRISNRNRRNKKASSPAPAERAETPVNRKEAEALAKAEEVLKARGLEGKNYFGEMRGSPKRQRTKSNRAGSSSEDVRAAQDSGGCSSRDDDIELMEDIGWIKGKEEVESLLNQRGEREGEGEDGGATRDPAEDDSDEEDATGNRGGQKFAKQATSNTSKPAFDYSTVGAIGAFDPAGPKSDNPFFSGAAVAGGHLNQNFGKTEKKRQNSTNGGRGRQSRRQVERPEKKDGRSQAYKKR